MWDRSEPIYPNDDLEPRFLSEHDYGVGEPVLPTDGAGWCDRLLQHIADHLALESNEELLYRRLAELGDQHISFLARLLGADEQAHHRLLLEFAEAVRARAIAGPDRSALGASALSAERRDEVLGIIGQLLQMEKDEEVELRELHRDVHLGPSGAGWGSVVEMMALDREKHVRVLKTLEKIL